MHQPVLSPLTLILLPIVVGLPFLSGFMSSGNRERMNVLQTEERRRSIQLPVHNMRVPAT